MDDSCAVCAETLEWVAYGPCGHREVCSTCVVRLRFICHDRRCCICKTESEIVFITKALGDYTRMINDFSVLPSDLREGRVGSYWYHEDTNAFFDDLDHYKMVKEMCRLSCSVCDKLDEQSNDASKKRAKFRNIEQLKGHLFHRHRLIMCSLCLEGRKIFICEQKLYTKAQLNQHINTGDSEVDGNENDRGGFTGHPMCEFCRTPFYGDNELFTHMSTEHYTCHICLRHHPGQYEYYKNYDDLEIHFRREHFLCEDDACLAKKFTVFQSEGEMKRHNAIEHGGRMSRAQRNAALQIPTSFRYQRSNEQGHRRGRGGRTFHRETSENQLSMAVQASLDMANSASSFHDPSSSSNAQIVYDHGDVVDPLIQPFDRLTTNDIDPPSRYLQAMSKSKNTRLEESSFPPLPGATTSTNQPNPSRSLPMNNLTSQQAFPSLRLGNLPIKKKNNRGSLPSSSNTSNQSLPVPNNAPVSSSSSPQIKHEISRGPVPNNAPVSTPAWPAVGQGHVSAGTSSRNPASLTNNTPVSLSSAIQNKPTINNTSLKSGYVSTILAWPAIDQGHSSSGSSSSSRKSSRTGSITHSASAPDLAERSFSSSDSQFPPVSATQMPKSSTPLIVKDVHTANKTLVEKMRAALEFDEDKYNAFKDISGQYRQGLIHTAEYLVHVHQFGLSDLIPDLARLCPDAQKQKELLETYNTNIQLNGLPGNGKGSQNISSKKNKGKATNSKSSLADSIMTSVRELQSSYRPSDIEVEKLSKDGYRGFKGKLTLTMVDQEQTKLNEKSGSPSSGAADVSNKQKQKKTSKFHRMRLGDGSVDAYLNARKYDSDPEPEIKEDSANGNTAEGLPVRGVWRKGGGKKLIGTASKDSTK